MRLFIAVDFPETLKQYLSEVGNSLKTDAATVAAAQEHHLTLKFLGEQTEEYALDLQRKLARVTFKPFEGKLTKIGTFTDSGRVRVVWGGIEPAEPFAALAKQIDELTPEVKNDYPSYNPHVTFARVKRIVAKEAFKSLLDSIKLEQRHFSVREFKLYKSIPGKEGHRYQIIQSYSAKA